MAGQSIGLGVAQIAGSALPALALFILAARLGLAGIGALVQAQAFAAYTRYLVQGGVELEGMRMAASDAGPGPILAYRERLRRQQLRLSALFAVAGSALGLWLVGPDEFVLFPLATAAGLAVALDSIWFYRGVGSPVACALSLAGARFVAAVLAVLLIADAGDMWLLPTLNAVFVGAHSLRWWRAVRRRLDPDRRVEPGDLDLDRAESTTLRTSTPSGQTFGGYRMAQALFSALPLLAGALHGNAVAAAVALTDRVSRVLVLTLVAPLTQLVVPRLHAAVHAGRSRSTRLLTNPGFRAVLVAALGAGVAMAVVAWLIGVAGLDRELTIAFVVGSGFPLFWAVSELRGPGLLTAHRHDRQVSSGYLIGASTAALFLGALALIDRGALAVRLAPLAPTIGEAAAGLLFAFSLRHRTTPTTSPPPPTAVTVPDREGVR